jgi:ABC-2 type transport system ATP-binding protein
MVVSLEAAGLTKRYGAHTGLDGVSFSADRGEVLGLLGPNGAGKTTAIRLLTTILPPTSGRFRVAGETEPVRIRQRIGALPESAGYPGRQTGAEYLRYHARLFGLSRADAAVVSDRLLAEVRLTDRARSRIATYSRGMRQRLGIARALVNDPAVVFLDEPTLGLDPAGQREVLAMISAMASARGVTVVLSTHALAEVEQTCDRVLILDHGRVVAEGTVAEIAQGGRLSDAFLALTEQDAS